MLSIAGIHGTHVSLWNSIMSKVQ